MNPRPKAAESFATLLCFFLGFAQAQAASTALPTVQTVAALAALPTTQFQTVLVALPTPAIYQSSGSPCTPVPAGNGTTQVGGSNGLCWVRSSTPVPVASGTDVFQGKVLGAGGTWVPPTTTTVTPQEYKLATDQDDTNSIRLALASCNSVEFSGSRTYTIAGPLPTCPGGKQRIFGRGPSSVIKLAATYDVTQATPCRAASDNATWRAIFYNVNCGGAVHTLVDTDIEYDNFKLDATAASGAAAATIGIFARNVQRLSVHDVTCDSFADCTAFLASQDTVVRDSIALRNGNAGFDHWDSPVSARVIDTVVYCTSGYGLLFNASDSTSTHDGIGVNYTAIGNQQYGCSTGVLIDPLTTGGLIQSVAIIGNLTDALAQAVTGGINVGGNVQGVLIASPTFRDFAGAAWGVLSVGPSLNVPLEGGQPDGVTISNPLFINVTVPGGGVAPLRLLGSANNRATGVTFAGSNAYPYAVDVDTTGTLIEGRLIAGSSGLANIHGSSPQINNLNYTNTTVTSCGSGPSIGGVSTKSGVVVGTGATTSCQVNFPAGAWAYTPSCSVTPGTAGDQLAIFSITSSAVVVTSAASMASHAFYVSCQQ